MNGVKILKTSIITGLMVIIFFLLYQNINKTNTAYENRTFVDKIEGNYIICENENGAIIKLKRDKLHIKIMEGDTLIITGDKIVKDDRAKKERADEIKLMVKKLWE